MRKVPARTLLLLAAFALFIVPVVTLAAGGFTDVDDDNVFVADIQWMKDNGITKGCNPPANTKFCPKNVVTREQMSAFMHRLATSKVVDAATAVNADMLDGKTVAKIAPIAVAEVDNTLGGTTIATPTTINTLSITVPANGVLIITGTAVIVANADGLYAIETYVGGTEIGVVSAADDFTTANDDLDATEWLSYTTAAAVTPGTYTVSQKIGRMSGTTGDLIAGSLFYNGNTMTVNFVPGGTVSASTAGETSGGTYNGG